MDNVLKFSDGRTITFTEGAEQKEFKSVNKTTVLQDYTWDNFIRDWDALIGTMADG